MPTVLLKLRSKLLAVLRLLLLEGRVLFCAKSAATVSEAGEIMFVHLIVLTYIPSDVLLACVYIFLPCIPLLGEWIL